MTPSRAVSGRPVSCPAMPPSVVQSKPCSVCIADVASSAWRTARILPSMTFDSAAVSGGETIVVCECAFFSFPAMLLNALTSGGCCVAWTARVSAATAATSVQGSDSRSASPRPHHRAVDDFGRPENPAAVRSASASSSVAVEHHDARLTQVADSRRRIAVDQRQIGGLADLDRPGPSSWPTSRAGTIVAAASASAGVKPAWT